MAVVVQVKSPKKTYWRYAGPVDDRTSQICRYLHGQVFEEGNPVHDRWAPPVHINCRHRQEPVTAPEEKVFSERALQRTIRADTGKPPYKVLSEAHFVQHPGWYNEYREPVERVPGPGPKRYRRPFVVVRVKDPKTGKVTTVLTKDEGYD